MRLKEKGRTWMEVVMTSLKNWNLCKDLIDGEKELM